MGVNFLLSDIDKYALMKLQNLVNVCRNAYDKFEYHIVYHAIHNFCVVDMSNFYLDIIKDRLYTEKPDFSVLIITSAQPPTLCLARLQEV